MGWLCCLGSYRENLVLYSSQQTGCVSGFQFLFMAIGVSVWFWVQTESHTGVRYGFCGRLIMLHFHLSYQNRTNPDCVYVRGLSNILKGHSADIVIHQRNKQGKLAESNASARKMNKIMSLSADFFSHDSSFNSFQLPR